MLQNCLAFRDSPIIPLRRSLSLSPSQARAKSLIPTIIFCRPPYHSSPASISLLCSLSPSLQAFSFLLGSNSESLVPSIALLPFRSFSTLKRHNKSGSVYNIPDFQQPKKGTLYFFFPVTEGQQGLDIILPAVISNSRFETYIMDEIVYFWTVLCCLVLCN